MGQPPRRTTHPCELYVVLPSPDDDAAALSWYAQRRRACSRLVQIRHCPVGSAPLQKMAGQLRGDRRRLRAIALLQALPHAAVDLHPLERPQPLGQHLAIERMVKPVAPADGPVRPLVQAGVLQEVVLLPERLTEGFDLGHRDVQPRRHRGGGKHVARHTGHFQDVLRRPARAARTVW